MRRRCCPASVMVPSGLHEGTASEVSSSLARWTLAPSASMWAMISQRRQFHPHHQRPAPRSSFSNRRFDSDVKCNSHHRQRRASQRFSKRSGSPRKEAAEVIRIVAPPFKFVDAVSVTSAAEPRVREFVRRALGHQAASSVEPDVRRVCDVVFDMPEDAEGDGGEDGDEDDMLESNKKIALLRFRVSATSDQWITAIGKASRKDVAVALSFMHALEWIHYLQTSETSQSTNDDEEDERPPSPMALRERLGSLELTRPPMMPRFPLLTITAWSEEAPSPSRDELGKLLSVWKEYTDNVVRYLPSRAEKRRAAYFRQYVVPFDVGEHPVHDLAAFSLGVGNSKDSIDGSAVVHLHNKIQAQKMPLPDVTYVRAHGATLATMPLQFNQPPSLVAPPLVAMGAGRNKKDARARCCMHALEILRMVETVDSEFGKPGVQTALHSDGGSTEDSPSGNGRSPYLASTLKVIPSNHAKALEAYLALTGQPCNSTFRRERSSAVSEVGMYRFVCTFQIGELSCEGQGINRYEAERSAVLVAVEELSDLDATFIRVADFVKKHPEFDAQQLVTLRIAPQQVDSLTASLKRCHAALTKVVHEASPQLLQKLLKHASCIGKGGESHTTASSLVPSWETIMHQIDVVSTSCTTKSKQQQQTEHHPATTSAPHSSDCQTDADAHSILQKISDNRALVDAHGGTSVVSDHMLRKLRDLRSNPVYLAKFHPRRSTLAMARIQDDVVRAVASNPVVIICGTTGCGKTTQVPQYIFDAEIEAGRGDRCSIIVSQPRRISAFSIAERIATERLQKVGDDVGYAVRLDSRPGKHITLCTTGILLQMFLGDRNLDNVTHLILDEVHERDINCDVALALAREVILRRKAEGLPQLHVIVMSATLDAEKFSTYFHGAPVLQIEGQTYPVKELFLEDVEIHARSVGFDSPAFEQMLHQRDRLRDIAASPESSSLRRLPSPPKIDYHLLAFAVDQSIQTFDVAIMHQKSILVFLPGWKEIMDAKSHLERLRSDLHIVLLHSTVDGAKQKECFQPAPSGRFKVILATNIAESGITIDDAAAVIDTGLIKLTSDHVLFNKQHAGDESASVDAQAATQLSLQYAGKANCTQRRGRAGRTQGGVCIRLFSRDVWEAMPAFLHPEILRVPLEQVLLRLLALGYGNPQEILLKFPDPPNIISVQRALHTLRSLEAITTVPSSPSVVSESHHLTPLGQYLTLLPCEPRIGKMIVLGALMHCLDPVLTLAAANDVNPFMTRRDLSAVVRKKRLMFSRRSHSDHVAIVNAYNSFVANNGSHAYAAEHCLSFSNLAVIAKYKRQFHEILKNARLLPRGGVDDDGPATKGNHACYVDRSHASDLWFDAELLKACLAASIYPQIAVLQRSDGSGGSDWEQDGRKKRSKKASAMSLRNGMTLAPSRESSCRPNDASLRASSGMHPFHSPQDSNTPLLLPVEELSPYFMYQGVFRVEAARTTFLTNVSPISPWAILLFAAPLNDLAYDSELQLLTISSWLHLKVDEATLSVALAVKQLFTIVMAIKFRDPAQEDNNKCLETIRRVCRALLQHQTSSQSSGGEEAHSGVNNSVVVAPWTAADQLRSDELQQAANDDSDESESD